MSSTDHLLTKTSLSEVCSFTTLRRVMVIGGIPLLDQGVFRMFSDRRDLEVFFIDGGKSGELTKLSQIHPDVIILCHTPKTIQEHLLDLLDDLPSLADIRIISIDLMKDNLEIYQHCRWFSADQQEFFTLLKS
jgi:hypothetical protein